MNFSSGLSRREVLELLQSTLVVGVVFTIAGKPRPDPVEVSLIFAVSCVVAGAGFILHELMHKVAAQTMGYQAEYHAGGFPYFSILFAFAGWILLAPGAVYISAIARPITRRANGIISLAGPATTFIVALSFLGLSFFASSLIQAIGSMGWRINIWLALFNMVPAPGFDGLKVWDWNKPVYVAFSAAMLVLFFTV